MQVLESVDQESTKSSVLVEGGLTSGSGMKRVLLGERKSDWRVLQSLRPEG